MEFGRPKGKPGKSDGNVQVIPGRWENGVCVGVYSVSNGGDPRAVSRSPTAKAEERGDERKEKARGSSHGAQRHGVK